MRSALAVATPPALVERFSKLTESGLLGVAVGNPAGRLIEADDTWLSMLGFDRQDLARGLSWAALTPPEWREAD